MTYDETVGDNSYFILFCFGPTDGVRVTLLYGLVLWDKKKKLDKDFFTEIVDLCGDDIDL